MPADTEGQLGEEAKRRLLNLFAAVEQWRRRTQLMTPPPEAGSSLRKDDDITHPYQLSHAVAGAMVSAIDHLDALRALVQDAHIVHARAPFTLLRAALENSATAVWLLAPPNRNERVSRRLRLQWADACDAERAAALTGAEGRLSRADWKDKLEGIGRTAGLSEDQVRGVTKYRATFGSIVETAGDETRGLKGQDALFCWMLASGIAHARLWAVLSSVLDRAEVPGAADGHVGMMLSASDKAVVLLCAVTAQMVTEGWRLFDERRQAYVL
ncbi:hypothetical protein [Amycolatopsis methanolica]|uniref:hypothetical protein n=1 Tax=Amycolatopsis methanolica TaxID=1814 RepID=UPI003430396E